MQTRVIVLICALFMLMPLSAFAQASLEDQETQELMDAETKFGNPDKPEGLDAKVTVGANFSLTSNNNVVGQTDGVTTLVGFSLISGLDYRNGRHEMRNKLNINETFSRTPEIPQFVKSSDLLEFESLYNLFITQWFGGYALIGLTTRIFESNQVSENPENYLVTRPDGTTYTETTDALKLADPFQPLELRESLGVFAEPYARNHATVTFRVGAGGRQTWADGAIVIDDDDDTDVTEAKILQDVFQAGLEGFAGVQGKVYNERINYDFGISILVPFLNNDDEDRSVGKLTRYGAIFNVGTKIFDWLSFSYQFRLVRDLQLVDDIQVQQAMLLSVNYNLIEIKSKEEGKAPEATSEEKLKAAEAALEAEKAKTTELEKQNADLQKSLEEAKQAPPEPTPQPSGDTPADGQPSGDAPADGQPSGDAPADGQPSGDAPADGQPAEEPAAPANP